MYTDQAITAALSHNGFRTQLQSVVKSRGRLEALVIEFERAAASSNLTQSVTRAYVDSSIEALRMIAELETIVINLQHADTEQWFDSRIQIELQELDHLSERADRAGTALARQLARSQRRYPQANSTRGVFIPRASLVPIAGVSSWA